MPKYLGIFLLAISNAYAFHLIRQMNTSGRDMYALLLLVEGL